MWHRRRAVVTVRMTNRPFHGGSAVVAAGTALHPRSTPG
ncbi:hypothetical protein Pd630_LPD07321 [Rhodococcus opacus PD630]|nr:hypothetical protein Pd630_LPD07321 [Rhodococcus opacus PD630]